MLTSMEATKRLTASTVSRRIRQAGLRPLPSGTPRSREGVRVSQGVTHVLVTADYDQDGTAARVAADIAAALTADGYQVTSPYHGALRVTN